MARGGLRRDEVLSLARRLISIESHKDAPGREAEIGRFLVGWFRDRGIDAELQPVDGDRANVIARIPGGGGPSLILNGHLDTVPSGDMPDAFSPRIEGGDLWGRGACDMKGAIAAMCCAMAAIAGDEASLRPNDSGQRGESLHRDKALGPNSVRQGAAEASVPLGEELLFAGTVDEETGSIGVKALVDAAIPAGPVGVAYWSDGGHLAANGIETIALGPGDVTSAHGPRDRVAVEELSAAAALYRGIVRRLLA